MSSATTVGRTEQLATFIASKSLANIDQVARDAALPAIADSIAAMLAGRNAQAGEKILTYVESSTPPGLAGGVWAAGLSNGASAENAALANGTQAHSLDYDDALPGAGHPSALLLAAILATAESAGQEPLTGDRLIESFVLGFEVVAKVAKAIGVKHYYKGWHTMSTAGSFGTAAAAAKVLGLDEAGIGTALGIAGSLASGIQRNFGTMTKPLHSGLAARNGVLSATLAAAGFTAAPNILDGDRGFLDLYSVDAAFPENLDDLGAPWSLITPGTALKKYPCCYATARPIDAILQLRAAHGLTSEIVDRIDVAVPKGGTQALLYSRPETGLGGKFSMEYVIAAGLVDGEVTLNSFTDEKVMRPVIRDLLEQVNVIEERDLRPEDPDGITSSPATGGRIEVRVWTKDGRNVDMSIAEPHGGPRNPLSWEDIETKFDSCVQFGGYEPDSAGRVFEGLRNLPAQSDVVALLHTLRVA